MLELNKSIELANAPSETTPSCSKKRKADEALREIFAQDDDYEDTDEPDVLDRDELDCTEDDIDTSLEGEDDIDDVEIKNFAYEPCACHNIQLVLKDGFAQSPTFENLIKKISKNIVTRSKFNALIAEELREFGKKFAKRVITRFNSMLFTARSVISVSQVQFVKIQKAMPVKTIKQKESRALFAISSKEREILEELVIVLGWFEWVNDELQSNRVSISRIYPCIVYLREKLTEKEGLNYTVELCNHLLISIEDRFGSLINKEVCNYLILPIFIFATNFFYFSHT